MNFVYHDKAWLEKHYIDYKWSASEIAKFCGVSQATIYKWIKKHNIKTRDFSESHLGKMNGAWVDSPIKEFNWVYQKYVVEKCSYREIAQESNVSLRSVARWIQNHAITPRTGSAAIIKDRSGENNPNWKGTTLCPSCSKIKSSSSKRCRFCHFNYLRDNHLQNPNYKGNQSFTSKLRDYTKSSWAPLVLERDGHSCQECKAELDLEAHHIVPFSVLRDQLVMEYSDLDVKEEKDILTAVKRAKQDVRISDLNNGITLCKKCHIGEHARIRQHKDDLIYRYYADVLKVLDADTIRIAVDLGFGIEHVVDLRLFGINAYELSSKNHSEKALAIKSKHMIEELCPIGSHVLVRTYKPGKYGGRWLGLLMIENACVNTFLYKTGLAKEYIL